MIVGQLFGWIILLGLFVVVAHLFWLFIGTSKALSENRYADAAKLIRKSFPFMTSGDGPAPNVLDGAYLALKGGDLVLADELAVRATRHDEYRIAALFLRVYIRLEQSRPQEAAEYLSSIKEAYAAGTIPQDVSVAIGVAEAAIGDTTIDRRPLLIYQKTVDDLFKGNPRAAYRSIVLVAVFLPVLVAVAAVVSAIF